MAMSATDADPRASFAPEYRWPQPWEGIGLYPPAQERPPNSGAKSPAWDAMVALLAEQPAGYWTAILAERLAAEHSTQAMLVRRDMLRLVKDGRAALIEDGQVWCSASSPVSEWTALKARAYSLLAHDAAPALASFAAIGAALSCSEVSAETLAWVLCEQDPAIHARYAGLFEGEAKAA
jgi:hypothetical protein